MSTREKLIAKLLALPTDMRFSEVRQILEWHGYEHVRTSGSHCIFRKAGSLNIDIPVRGGQVVSRTYLKNIVRDLNLKG